MKRKDKLVIWDLCGGSQNSIRKTIDEYNLWDKFELYTFDVATPRFDTNIQLDLVKDFELLDNYKKPDIVVASPICASFSQILQLPNKERLGWKWENGKYVIREIDEIDKVKQTSNFFKKMDSEKLYTKAALGGILANRVIQIIQKYQPKYWYIENPKMSLLWDWYEINYNFTGIKNLAHYNNYDENFTQKPTIFLSNINLDLKSEKIKCEWKAQERAETRSHICKLGSDKFYKNGSRSKDLEQDINVLIPHSLLKAILDKFGEDNERQTI